MHKPPQSKSHFEKLASELIQHIYELCSVNTKLSLRLCCKTLSISTPGTARELYKSLNYIVDFGDARFDRLCLDDTYTGTTTRKHVCSICRCLHRVEEFTRSQLDQRPETRVCAASQRFLDLTPSISFTYQQLLASKNIDLPVAFPYTEGFTFRPAEDASGQWTIMMDWSFKMRYLPLRAWEEDLRRFLENFPVCACPHLTSCEPQVLQTIFSCGQDEDACSAIVKCTTCATKIEFAFLDTLSGKEWHWNAVPGISFHVERKVGKLGKSAVDPRWKAQSLPLPQT